jgi:hypothetical protein
MQHTREATLIPNVRLNYRSPTDETAVARREIVEHDGFVSCGRKCLATVAANITGTPEHQNSAHLFNALIVIKRPQKLRWDLVKIWYLPFTPAGLVKVTAGCNSFIPTGGPQCVRDPKVVGSFF